VNPPTNKSILKCHRNFIERGYICDQRKGHSGRPSVSDQVVDRCQLGHAGYAAESLVRARLSHWCLPSNKRGAHWVCVIVSAPLYRALRLCTSRTAHRGSRGMAILFHYHRHYKGVRGQCHAPAALYPPGNTRYLLYRRVGGPEGRSGQVRKISPPHQDSIPQCAVHGEF
jgi:hypothetical protein